MRPGNRVYLGREGQREEYCEPVRNGGARPTTREKSATAARAELAVVTSAAFDRPRAWCCRASLAFVHCALFEPFCLSDVWTVWTHGASDLAVSGARRATALRLSRARRAAGSVGSRTSDAARIDDRSIGRRSIGQYSETSVLLVFVFQKINGKSIRPYISKQEAFYNNKKQKNNTIIKRQQQNYHHKKHNTTNLIYNSSNGWQAILPRLEAQPAAATTEKQLSQAQKDHSTHASIVFPTHTKCDLSVTMALSTLPWLLSPRQGLQAAQAFYEVDGEGWRLAIALCSARHPTGLPS